MHTNTNQNKEIHWIIKTDKNAETHIKYKKFKYIPIDSNRYNDIQIIPNIQRSASRNKYIRIHANQYA